MSTFKNYLTTAIALGMVLFVLVIPARADTIDFSNPAFAPTGKQTSVPIGAAEFCKSHRADCARNVAPVAAMPLTEARWNQLVDTNNLVNAAIVPVTDEAYYSVAEYWTYPAGYGDCEDYALAKRQALIADGWDPSVLLMTVVRQGDGSGHAVLLVRTDRGDVVLDNQDGRVLVWNQTPYQFLKRQSQNDAAKWVDIRDARPVVIAASR